MTLEGKAKLLTVLGARAAHRSLSGAFRQPFFDHLGGAPSREAMEHAIEHSRYYAWANLIRAAIYVPVLVGLQGTGHHVSIAVIFLLVVFHMFCVLAEAYKANAARIFQRRGGFAIEPARPQGPTEISFLGAGYYKPKPFESERGYRLAGFEVVRRLVNIFIEWSQLTREERNRGKKPRQMAPTRAGMVKYESETRQAERMHLLAGSLNLPPLASFLLLGKWGYAGWVGFILVIDGALVLLQRYLRLRVVNRLNAIERRRLQGAATP